MGDTGEPWGALPAFLFEGQLAVGAALQNEHAAHPAEALILLGDNFYPDGLLEDEVEARILENLVRPLCAFIEPTPALRRLTHRNCWATEAPPPKLFAVVGNHDVRDPGSAQRQQQEIPKFVGNWDLPTRDGPVVRELRGGISLIFLETEWPWTEERTDALADALVEARGPWRIVVGHRPAIAGHPALTRMIEQAASQSNRIIHLYLGAHVHVLSAIRNPLPAPALTAIAGSGAHAELQSDTEYHIDGADFVAEALGFVRIEITHRDDRTPAPPSGAQGLRVDFIRAHPSAALAFLGNQTIARYEVQLDGTVQSHPLP